MGSLRENLALNLKIRRSILGISQAQLAERAGISPGYVGGLETLKNWPADDKAEKLAKALNVDDPGLLFIDPNGQGAIFDIKDLDMVLSRTHDQIIKDIMRSYGFKPESVRESSQIPLRGAETRAEDFGKESSNRGKGGSGGGRGR